MSARYSEVTDPGRVPPHGAKIDPGKLVFYKGDPMLNELVTRALSRLNGDRVINDQPSGRFRYANASDDGQYVAIVAHDHTTYVVDLDQDRFCAEPAGEPCGFSGHVLQMEREPVSARVACVGQFDLDLDRDVLDWRRCPKL